MWLDRTDERGWRAFAPSEPRTHARGHIAASISTKGIITALSCLICSPPERPRQDLMIHPSERVHAAGLDVLEHHLGGAEEEGVDGVEVVLVAGEDGREWLAVIARGGRRDLPADLFQAGVVAGHVEHHAGAVE